MNRLVSKISGGSSVGQYRSEKDEEIRLEKVHTEDLSSQLGKSHRNAITGKVTLKGVDNFHDFFCVDLFARGSIEGTVDQLTADPYLFRPVLMNYRTWLYHYDYTDTVTSFKKGEHSMLRIALDHQCNDAPVSAGRWSPIIAYVPIALAMALTGDNLLITLPLIIVGILHLGTTWCNNAKWYKFLRPVTLIPRFGFFVYLAIRLVLDFQGLGGAAILGFVLSLMFALVDIVAGDGSILFGMRLQCTYAITHVLPSRIFICRRDGACQLEDLFGPRGRVSEIITGFSPWEATHTLIADIAGLIVELRPLQKEDWKKLAALESTTIHYLGLDVFDESVPSTMDLINKANAASAPID